jgi:phosphoglycolate phosphatase-like HAD superfamily hydrolase
MEAFSETFGIETPHEVPFSGRTDRGIARNLFGLHDIENSPQNWELLRAAYLERLPRYLPRRPGEVLPGVPELLARLAQPAATSLGLLTGNASEGARLKLEHYGLADHFSFGGYGDQHVDRDDVAHEAMAAYRAISDGQPEPQQVWVVGDTPLDIRCARVIGAKVLAVATGWHDRQLLQDADPDLLLEDLRPTDKILEHLLEPSRTGR